MKIFEYQIWHFLLLLILLIGLYILSKSDQAILEGNLWNISTQNWYLLAILIPIVHQIYVLICWRAELYYNSLSNFFGDKGFKIYKKGFAVLMLSRPVLITLLAISNANSLYINPVFTYFVRTYFGIDRAMGIDHFYPEKFKQEPFVKKGIFKYTNNGMYIYGFFILWIPGILLQSKAALLVALFSHIYIWVHYYFTELPDIKKIYTKL